MGKIIKTCSACEFWDVENAKDKIAECLWKFPSMPISRGLVTPSLWASISKVRGDAGGNCPCWKARSNLEEKGITFKNVLEENTERTVRILEDIFFRTANYLWYKEDRCRRKELTKGLANVCWKVCQRLKPGSVDTGDYDKTVEELHRCLLRYMKYSPRDGAVVKVRAEFPVRCILGTHFLMMYEVYRRFVREERD